MLTKDLLRYQTPGGKIHPQFIAADDAVLLAFASSIIKTYADSLHVPKNEIEESLHPLLNSLADRKLALGLLKLFDDQCVYSGDGFQDWPAMRTALFQESSRQLLEVQENDTYSDFRTKVFARAGSGVIPLNDNIYADLPDYERLEKIPDMTPDYLLEKYNTALAQSFVLYANSLNIVLEESNCAAMRRFFKYLRFFRLLADITKTSAWENDAPGAVHLKIDGPASILENSAKYGLQLASFLPALFQLKKWKFTCDVKIGEKQQRFSLDETSGLHLRFGRLGIHVPEELRMFAELFRSRIPEWELSSDSPFLRGKKMPGFVFPDMMFTKGKRKKYLELFHRWHARQLPDRLEFLTKNPKIPLILGVERKILTASPNLRERVESHPDFEKRIFLFRDFPSIEKLEKLL